MRVLVTGSDGFVGRHVVRALRVAGHEPVEWPGFDAEGGTDVRDAPAVLARIGEAVPDAVVHLAGQSSVARSHDHPAESFDVNATGTVNVLQAARTRSPRARVLVVGSGEVYGAIPAGAIADETFPLAPRSPYAAGKAAAELAALQFHRSYGLDVVCARPFNHVGRGQSPHFVMPSFARQIAAERRGETAGGVLLTGDLSPVRDFSHVEDVVAAYLCLLQRGTPGGVYNVASGVGTAIGDVVARMLSLSGVHLRLQVDPDRVRPVEVPVLVGSSRALRALGWSPRRTLDDALVEVLREHGALDADPAPGQ